MNNSIKLKFKKCFSLLLALTISLLTVIPSFAINAEDNSNNILESSIKQNMSVNKDMKEVNIVKANNNYIEYTFKKDSQLYLAKEYIKSDISRKSSIKSEFFKIENGDVNLIKVQETEIYKKDNKMIISEVWTITKVYHKINKNLKHRTKFAMSLYSNSARTRKVGPIVSYIEKGLR